MKTLPHIIERLALDDDALRLVQLTDTHLCRERGGRLLGMDTDHSLQCVIQQLLQERPVTHLVLGTGDLADNGAEAAYARLGDYFAQIPAPSFWLPGNHDARAVMASSEAGAGRLCHEVRAGHWQILLLDSQIPGEVGGRLGASELQRLEQALASAAREGLHTLVCLHHHPVRIGCAWLDEQMVADAEAFFGVLDRFSGVRGVLWGHIHQEVDTYRKQVRLLGSPSTCVQFAPGSEAFKADDKPPGYRWLELRSDGGLETGVSRVLDVRFDVDLASRGYL
ncbi:MAG: 3',5'-cyclic-AMP phosphodiesterase [Halioglobus sp.]